MPRFRLQRPSPSMIVALLALFVALGGTAFAAARITGADIKNGTITGKDIKDGSLTGKQVKLGSLSGKQLASESVKGAAIDESSLGKVPSAADADTLGGKPASAFTTSAMRWVLVKASPTDPTILAQSGGFGKVTRIDEGAYAVDAGESVVGRPLLGSFGRGGQVGLGFISTAPCGGSVNNPGGVTCAGVDDTRHVFVRITNQVATPSDNSMFYLVIPA